MIDRSLIKHVESKLFKGKAIVLTGPRQVGKTTLIRKIISHASKAFLFLNGDDPSDRQILQNPSTEQLRQIMGTADIIFIDEAQRLSNFGLTAKIITDQFPDKQLILSGSSSFDLNAHIQEPLTGRKWSFELFPLCWNEWQDHIGYAKSEQDLNNRLVFGFYPDVLNHPEEQREVLRELAESYLYKDVLTFGGIRKPEVIQKLVQALAYQVGCEVVYKEVADLIGLDPKTVSSYIDILEKAYVLFRLPSFSRNLRNEIKVNQKIYFYDNGIRNAVISAYQPLAARQDVGMLWENFLVSERVKQMKYRKIPVQQYFWRTTAQQEIDYVEELDDKIYGFEFKWNPRKKIRFSRTFTETYHADTMGVNRDNFRDFVMMA